jgi:hypothetical protein
MSGSTNKPAKKLVVNKLITLSVPDARVLRDIAANKGMNSKNYIEYLVNGEIEKHRKKQLKLL